VERLHRLQAEARASSGSRRPRSPPSASSRPLRAKRFFKLAVEKGSTNPTVYLRYGNILSGSENAAAAEMYRKGLEFDPINPGLWAALGRLTRGLEGDENKAAGKRMIELARELDPESVDTWLLVEDAMEKEGPPPSRPAGGGDDGD
jgi:hypothetical protein